MATERRNLILLGAVLVVLAGVGYRQFAFTSSGEPAASNQSSQQRQAPARGGASTGPGVTAPDVHLDALNAERPKPSGGDRNLFRFKPKAPPPPPVVDRRPPPTQTPVAQAPSGPPAPPPIALKFLGTINSEGKTLAILSDGQGPAMYGIEGGTIAGRYRIVRVGVESVEVSYLDGRGRQTIRVGGQ